MRLIIAIWRLLFGRQRSTEGLRQTATQLNSVGQGLLANPTQNALSLGQMDYQVAAMAQIPLTAREINVQFSPVTEEGISGVVSESDMMTPDGIRAQKIHHLIVTGSGHVTKASGIKVKCQVCGQFDSTIHRCLEPTCHVPLCELHAIQIELYGQKVCYCPAHAISAANSRDNWREYWLARERNRNASAGT